MNTIIACSLLTVSALAQTAAIDPRGAVADSPLQRDRLVFSVQDFKAKGDGSTVDTAHFQDWLKAMAAAPDGAYGYCPQGRTYLIDGTLALPPAKGPVRITGGCTLRFYNATHFAVGFSSSAADFEMDHVAILSTVASVQRLISLSAAPAHLHDLTVTATLADVGAGITSAIVGTSLKDLEIDRSVLTITAPARKYATYAIVSQGNPNSRWRIHDNTVIATNVQDPLACFNCVSSWIRDNYVDQGNFTQGPNRDGYGILIYQSAGPAGGDHVVNNIVTHAASSCIYFASVLDSEISGNILSNCAIQDPAGSLSIGCVSWGGGARAVIANNVCTKSGQAGIDASQFDEVITGASNLTITGNTITDAATFGIWLRGGVRSCTVSANTIDGRPVGTSTVDTSIGIYSNGTTALDNCAITANPIKFVSQAGIGVTGGQNNSTFSSNAISHVTAGYGILLKGGGSGGIVANNMVGDLAGAGIRADTPHIEIDNNSVHDVSRISGADGNGIEVEGIDSHVSGNKVRNSQTGILFAGNGGFAVGNDLRGNAKPGIGWGSTTGGLGLTNRFSDNPMTGTFTMPGGTPNETTVTGVDAGDGPGPLVQRTSVEGTPGECYAHNLTATSFEYVCTNPGDRGGFLWTYQH